MVGPNAWAKKCEDYGACQLLRQAAACRRRTLTIVLALHRLGELLHNTP